MANIYVSSVDGLDADNGSTWALAKATVAGALAIAVNGDVIYVDSAHNFSSATTITWNAAANANVAIISVNRAGSTTTGHSGWLAGATESIGTIGFSTMIAPTGSQGLYIYGMSILANSGNNSANSIQTCATAENTRKSLYFENCILSTPTANSNDMLLVGQNGSSGHANCNITFKGCAFVIRNAANLSGMRFNNVNAELIHCTFSYSGATKPAALFGSTTGAICRARIIDCDLTGYEKAGGAYVDALALHGSIEFVNCKLHATPAIVINAFPNNAGSVTLVNCDSADTKNVFEFRNRLGVITESFAVFANNAAQMNGTNVSWQIVTSAACNEMEPFVTPGLAAWGDSLAAQNAGFRIIHDSVTPLTNRTCWAEVEYVSDASFPKGTMGTTRIAQPFDGSATNLPTDTEAWSGTGGFVNPLKQKVDVNFTPAEKSLLRGRLSVAVASKTLFIAPQLWLS